MRALLNAAFALIVPLVLVGGILGGWFSSIEAGAITAGATLLIGTLVYRSMSFADIAGAIGRTLRLSASVFVIIAAAGPFSWLLTRLGAIDLLQHWLLGYAHDPIAFTAAMLGLILVAGMFMDATANILILGPMLISVAGAAGYPPVQSALIVVVGFLLGTVTPPVGVCYFTASLIAGAKLEQVAVEMLPFMAAELLVLVAMFFISPLTLSLPAMLGLG